ncbi:MAG: aminoacyl-tRNA hydrolase [Tannerellaceae bacterium]|nr:aminoacyl-tRNA hydrolase [Tannerellaceae bacterium]
MDFLVAGLGNVGSQYAGTRHNVGFRIVNHIADQAGVPFSSQRYGLIARLRIKNAGLILLKPNTFMNLSGDAVRFWLQKEKLPVEQLLVIVDDIALPFGSLRLKTQGSHAGHNGLKHIHQQLGTHTYSRLRFGIGNDFPQGRQIDYVLGAFSPQEVEALPALVNHAADIVRTFCLEGPQTAMNRFN